MKITDYLIVTGEGPGDLRAEVLARVAEGWEISGGVQLLQKPVRLFQPMVKKLDPHAGEVFVREPGKQGHWEKVALPVSG
jgi:hypothetical protein